jgi:hypothetical protein
MKWFSLKINFFPLVMKEVDIIIEKYICLINEMKETGSDENFKEFDDLRVSVIFLYKKIDFTTYSGVGRFL